ncbi:hypothetical protein CO675_00395 [Bradyrhizobium sp. C9]|nr:hypothetical protein CO675_00395 [Bradyrhizobium sp. C9]
MTKPSKLLQSTMVIKPLAHQHRLQFRRLVSNETSGLTSALPPVGKSFPAPAVNMELDTLAIVLISCRWFPK